MIRIKRTPVMSAKVIAQFTAHSRSEWRKMRSLRAEFYRNTHGLWTIYSADEPLCVIGIKRNSLIGTGIEVYFMLCNAFQSHLKECVRFLRRAFRHAVHIFGMITVSIEEGYATGAAFVKFFSFRPVPRLFEAQGIKYTHYELRASWLS